MHRIYTVYKMSFFHEIYLFSFIEDGIINIFSFKGTF